MEMSIGCCCRRRHRRRRLDEEASEALEVDGSAREDGDGTSSWCSSEEERVLAQRFGESTTAAERRRFFIDKGSHVKKASAALESYVKWRPTLELSSSSSPLDPFAALSSHGRPMPSTTVSFVEQPSANKKHAKVELDVCRDREGKRLVYFLLLSLDPEAGDPATFTRAAAIFLDRALDRYSDETLTVALDVRPGIGYAGITPPQILAYIKELALVGVSKFPERLHRVVLYPMPRAAIWIWNLAKLFLPSQITSKVTLLTGPMGIDDPPPNEIYKYIYHDQVDALEAYRQQTFLRE